MEDDPERSPFARPGFLIAAVTVALIVVLGVTITVLNSTRNNPGTPAAKPTVSAPTVQPTKASAASDEPSLCGLDAKVPGGSLSTPPTAQWKYQGTTAYPTSPTYGPGKTDRSGFSYCFHHSPGGALFATAAAVAEGSNPASNAAWSRWFVADGPYRDKVLAEGSTTSPATGGTRITIAGFRILSYTGARARVDIAVNGSAKGRSIIGSFVYDLVWQSGDWKLSTDTENSFDFAVIPDLAGYTPWGA